MNLNALSPYIRRAMRDSIVKIPWLLSMRILFEYEILYLEHGFLDITVDGVVYHLAPGDIIMFCPRQPHEIRSVGTDVVSQPHILFDLEYDQYSDKIPISFRNIDAFTDEEKRMIRVNAFPYLESPMLKVDNMDYFLELFFDVIDTWAAGKDMYMIESKYKLIRLLLYLFKCNPSMVSDNKTTRHSSLGYVKDYIDNNYCNIITLDSLSSMFHINKYYLTRRFREEFGVPVIQYYRMVLIDAAKKCLQQNPNVTKTAYQLGFENIYAFSRFFKNTAGITPREYIYSVQQTSSFPSTEELHPVNWDTVRGMYFEPESPPSE